MDILLKLFLSQKSKVEIKLAPTIHKTAIIPCFITKFLKSQKATCIHLNEYKNKAEVYERAFRKTVYF